jgi:hypothetical protein
MDRILDAELAWHDFQADVIDNPHSDLSGHSRRYVRINPNVGKVPKLDQKREMRQLQSDTVKALQRREMRAKVQNVAFRLVASLFYYERHSTPKADGDNIYQCSGKLLKIKPNHNSLTMP